MDVLQLLLFLVLNMLDIINNETDYQRWNLTNDTYTGTVQLCTTLKNLHLSVFYFLSFCSTVSPSENIEELCETAPTQNMQHLSSI